VHDIHVSEDSLLKGIVRKATGQINSAHHQAVDRIGEGLHAVAHSPDNVIEGLEWEHPEGKPFLLLVQWHPERMTDRQSPFSYEIAKAFINSINGH
jgi:putative glutamine amidotransferase